MSLRRKSVVGVFWAFLQQFSNQLVSFLVSIVLARILVPEDFGLVGMLAVFMAVSQVLVDAGLTQSIVRQSKPSQLDYSTVFFFNLSASVVVYLGLFLSAGSIASFYNQPILEGVVKLLGVVFIINAFSAVQFTRLTKQLNFKVQMVVTVPSLLVGGVAGVLFAYYGYGVWSLVYMNLIQAFLRAIQVWWYSGWVPTLSFSYERFSYHFRFSYKLALSGLLDTFFKNIYQIIIGKYFLVSEVGYYTRAVTMKDLPISNLSTALNRVTYPMFAEIKDDNVRLKRAYQSVMQLVLFVIAPVMVYLAVVAEPLFRALLTEKWLPAVPYFQIMCVGAVLYPIHSYNLNIIKVKGRSDLFLKLELIKKVITICVILVSIKYGILGLLYGQIFSSVVALFINSFYSGKFIVYSLWEQLKHILPILILALLVGCLVYFIDLHYFSPFNDIFRILFCGVIGLIFFLGCSHLVKLEAYHILVSLIRDRR